MSTQLGRGVPELDAPVPWPHPDEGLGLGGPPSWVEEIGAWVVSAYDDVDSVLRDPDGFSSRWVTGPYRGTAFAPILTDYNRDPRAEAAAMYFHIGLIDSDGPLHEREHGFVKKAFTPKRVRALEPTIRALCEDLAAGVVGRRDVAFVRDFTVPLPVKVIANGLGLRPDDYLDLKRWSDGFQRPIGTPEPTPEAYEEFLTACWEFTQYVTPLIEQRRAKPADDIISVLAQPGGNGDELTDGEILSLCAALLLAGNETSTAALAGTMLYLIRVPGFQAKVRADREMIPAVVEECLRLTAPAQVLFRTANADREVAGVKISRGQHVLLRFAAANRDEARFEDPLTPRLDRPDKRHLTFGRGLHTCLGAPLARTEIRVAFETLIERSSEFRLADREEPVIATGNEMTAGIGELYVDIDA